MTTRCDEIMVQLVFRTYNEDGEPIQEQVSPPTKLFRATTPQVWEEVDKALATVQQKVAP